MARPQATMARIAFCYRLWLPTCLMANCDQFCQTGANQSQLTGDLAEQLGFGHGVVIMFAVVQGTSGIAVFTGKSGTTTAKPAGN